jgi:hypothetical protein
MNALQRIIGAEGVILIPDDTPITMPAGKSAYALLIRIDGTEVSAVDYVLSEGTFAVSTTGESWQGVSLQRGDLVSFEYPVTAITLGASGDSAFAYIESSNYLIP